MRRPPIVDLALAAGAAALSGLLTMAQATDGHTWYEGLYLLIHVGLMITLLTRTVRRRESFVATYTLLAAMGLLVNLAPTNLGVSPVILCAPLALYKVARHDPPAWGAAALLLGIAGSFVSPINRLPGRGNGTLIVWMILIMVGTYLWASGRRRTEVAYEADLARARFEHDRESSLRVEQAQTAERARIAREIHDIVAHSLAVVNVQASTALTIGTEDHMRASLTSVRDASKDALQEVRSLVGVLRDGAPDREVAGDLARLPALVDEARSAGVRLEDDLPGEEALKAWGEAWSASCRLAVVRVVQEALSNVIKHGGRAPAARLSVRVEGDRCIVEVTNDRRSQGESSGFGLPGLRERVTLVGGEFAAGPNGEGFAIRAEIPTTKEQT